MLDKMPAKVIREWLAEYKSLSEAEIHSYAATVRNNEELIDALYDFLEDEDPDHEIMEPVCHQLFEFYRCKEADLQRFTLEMVPTLISAYLTSISRNNKKSCRGIEACLLGIYNLEIVNEDGSPKVQRFTLPLLSNPSIYHEPMNLACLSLTENALSQYDFGENLIYSNGPYPQVESLNAQNRLGVISYVLRCYNADIARLSSLSHQALYKACSRLTNTGFCYDGGQEAGGRWSSSSSESRRGVQFKECPRVTLNSGLLVDMLEGIYYVMFNGNAKAGIRVVEDIHRRANYELYTEALLVTNAIRNSLQFNPSGQPTDGPMGISIALSPTTSTTTLAKSAITNASFRTKKLPDDIEVPGDDESPSSPPNYDEILEQDRAKVKVEQESKVKPIKPNTKPLKSMLKKSSDRRRKDSDSPSKTPGSGTTSINGDVADSSVIQVTVTNNKKHVRVDSIEMNAIGNSTSAAEHHWSASAVAEKYKEEEGLESLSESSNGDGKPSIVPASHTRDLNGAKNSSTINTMV